MRPQLSTRIREYPGSLTLTTRKLAGNRRYKKITRKVVEIPEDFRITYTTELYEII